MCPKDMKILSIKQNHYKLHNFQYKIVFLSFENKYHPSLQNHLSDLNITCG